MHYYDSHCHLLAIDSTQNNLLSIIPSIVLDDIVALSVLDRDKYKIGAGLHPWYVGDINIEQYEILLESHINQYAPDAIGEVGLDKLKPNYAKQCEIFEVSCKLAHKYNLPLIIHCVRAYSDVLHYISKYQVSGIVHAFNQNLTIAQELINKGMYLGVGSLLDKSVTLQNVVKNIDSRFILLESDAPYMVNSSQYTQDIAKLIAKIKDCNESEYLENSFSSIKSLFNHANPTKYN